MNKPGWGPVTFRPPGAQGSGSYRDAMISWSLYGPTFGWGHDFFIASDASLNTNSYSNFGYSYNPPVGHSYGSSFTKSFLAGSYNFRPDEVEVFYETIS